MSHETDDGLLNEAVLNSALMESATGHIADHGLEGIVDTLFAEADRTTHETLQRLFVVASSAESSYQAPTDTTPSIR